MYYVYMDMCVAIGLFIGLLCLLIEIVVDGITIVGDRVQWIFS